MAAQKAKNITPQWNWRSSKLDHNCNRPPKVIKGLANLSQEPPRHLREDFQWLIIKVFKGLLKVIRFWHWSSMTFSCSESRSEGHDRLPKTKLTPYLKIKHGHCQDSTTKAPIKTLLVVILEQKGSSKARIGEMPLQMRAISSFSN